MIGPKRMFVLVALAALLMGACQRSTKVGSEELLKAAEDKKAEAALRQKLEETEAPAASPAPIGVGKSPTASPTTGPREEVFEVTLIHDNPYYQPVDHIIVGAGTRIRVTNRDDRPRHWKSDPEGVFDSGPIAPGKTWEYVATQKGKFGIFDDNVPFATATLEVK